MLRVITTYPTTRAPAKTLTHFLPEGILWTFFFPLFLTLLSSQQKHRSFGDRAQKNPRTRVVCFFVTAFVLCYRHCRHHHHLLLLPDCLVPIRGCTVAGVHSGKKSFQWRKGEQSVCIDPTVVPARRPVPGRRISSGRFGCCCCSSDCGCALLADPRSQEPNTAGFSGAE